MFKICFIFLASRLDTILTSRPAKTSGLGSSNLGVYQTWSYGQQNYSGMPHLCCVLQGPQLRYIMPSSPSPIVFAPPFLCPFLWALLSPFVCSPCLFSDCGLLPVMSIKTASNSLLPLASSCLLFVLRLC